MDGRCGVTGVAGKCERTFAWLGNFRRLVVRYERHLPMYRAFFHLACALIALRFLQNEF